MNLKFLHMWINFFSTYPIVEIDDKYQVWLRPDDDMIVKKRGVGEIVFYIVWHNNPTIMVAVYGDHIKTKY